MRLKTFMAGLALLLIGLVAIAAAALKSVDFNAYKEAVAQQIKVALGRDLIIAGDVNISIGLRPHLTAKQLILRNAAWSDQAQMVALDQIDVGIELLPLLFEQIRLRDVVLSGGQILLERNKDGVGNWAFDGSASNGDTATPLPEIDKLVIENFKLRYRDPARNQDVEMVVSRFSAKTPAAGGPVSWGLAGTIGKAAVDLKGIFGTLSQVTTGPTPVNIRGSIDEISLQLAGTIQNAVNLTGLDLDIQLAGKDAAKLNPVLGITLPATQKFSLGAHLTDPDGGYHLDHLQLAMGGSTITGTAAILPQQERPLLRAQLTADHLDLVDFGLLAPSQQDPSGGTGPIFSNAPWSLGWMRRFDAEMDLAVKELLRGQPILKDGRLTLSLKKGVMTLQSFQARMGGGTINASGTLHGETEPAALDLKAVGNGVSAAPLLAATGLSDVLSAGDVDLDLAVNGPANSAHDLMAGLSGYMSFSTGNGTLRNNFARLLLADATKLVMFGGTEEAARVSCLAGAFDITGGIARTRGIVLDTPGAAIVGTGSIDLGHESLHMRLDSKSKEVSLAALAIPVILSGNLRHPTVTPDPIGAVANTSDFVAGTADYVTLGALSALTGLGKQKSLGDNPCAALANGASRRSSVGDKVKQGADNVKSDAEHAIQGAGNVAKDVGKQLDKNLNSLFGN